MMNAISHDETPNFYFMQYELATWRVKNLLLVPSFAFPPSAIIKRKPLAPTARRAGWVGCNIALNRVPVEARILVVTESTVMPASEVREKFRRVKPLKDISVTQRGWTLDVLNAVRSLGKVEFSNDDAYSLVTHLEKLHPDNRHVRDKIRQQSRNAGSCETLACYCTSSAASGVCREIHFQRRDAEQKSFYRREPRKQRLGITFTASFPSFASVV
jgi:type II restriction enzyme